MAVAVGRGVDVGFGIAVAVGGGSGVLDEVAVGSGVVVGAEDNPAQARPMAANKLIKNRMGERLIFMPFSFGFVMGRYGMRKCRYRRPHLV